MKGPFGEILGAVFLLALVVLLVRPDSLAPKFIEAFGTAITAVTEFAVSA